MEKNYIDLLFSVLYDLAKHRDKQALEAYRKVGVFLDAWFGRQRLLYCFAKEKNREVVDFLINEFELDKDAAAEGYAQAGELAAVNRMLQQGASKVYVINGYAQGGHRAQIQGFLDERIFLNNAIEGYAQGGYVAEVDALLRAGGEKNSAVFSYAWVGNQLQVERLLAVGASINHAQRGYAWGGHVAQVSDLLRRGGNFFSAIAGYALGGYTEAIEELEWSYGKVNIQALEKRFALSCQREKIWNYAIGGHLKPLRALLHSDKDKALALAGYLRGQHPAQMNHLLSLPENKDIFEFKNPFVLIKGLLFSKADYKNPQAVCKIQRFLSFINLPKLQCYIYEAMNANLQLIDGKNKKAKLAYLKTLNKLMRNYQLSYPEAQLAAKAYIQIWFLQGFQLVKMKRIDAYIFLMVSSYLTGLSLAETTSFFKKYQKHASQYFQDRRTKSALFFQKSFKNKENITVPVDEKSTRFFYLIRCILSPTK